MWVLVERHFGQVSMPASILVSSASRTLGWKVRLGPGCPDIRLALSLSGGLAQPRGRLLQLPLRTLHGHTRVNSPCWSLVPSWWSYTLVEKMNEHT